MDAKQRIQELEEIIARQELEITELKAVND